MAQRREKGTGSITQRKDGTWQGRFDAGIKSDGKRDVKYVYAKTEAECKRKLKDLIKVIHKTEYVYVQRQSVEDFLNLWLNSAKKLTLKPKSFDRLEETLNYDVIPYIGKLQLQALTSDDIQKMVDALFSQGKSQSTIKKSYQAVNAAFKWGLSMTPPKVKANPAVGVTLPAKKLFPAKKIQFYTEDEARQLCNQALSTWSNDVRRYPLGSFVPLLINTGLRMGELLALQWERDIDLDSKTLTVHSNLAFVKDRDESSDRSYKVIEQETVKTDAGQDRSIPLNDAAYNALLDIWQVTSNELYVMTTREHTVVKPRQLDQMFRRIATAAGFAPEKIYGVHSLRHTFATMLLSRNVDIKTVSKLLGHSDVSITYNTYIHVLKEQERKALSQIPNLT